MYVKTTFPIGKLNKEIYMEQPTGFEVNRNKRKVRHLKRFIKGLNNY